MYEMTEDMARDIIRGAVLAGAEAVAHHGNGPGVWDTGAADGLRKSESYRAVGGAAMVASVAEQWSHEFGHDSPVGADLADVAIIARRDAGVMA